MVSSIKNIYPNSYPILKLKQLLRPSVVVLQPNSIFWSFLFCFVFGRSIITRKLWCKPSSASPGGHTGCSTSSIDTASPALFPNPAYHDIANFATIAYTANSTNYSSNIHTTSAAKYSIAHHPNHNHFNPHHPGDHPNNSFPLPTPHQIEPLVLEMPHFHSSFF
jgi:hypothetical protein